MPEGLSLYYNVVRRSNWTILHENQGTVWHGIPRRSDHSPTGILDNDLGLALGFPDWLFWIAAFIRI